MNRSIPFALAISVFIAAQASGQQPVNVLNLFNGTDGANPVAALIQGTDGNFYGTTQSGGASNLGTVFKMTPSGIVTVLHSFAGGSDGASPKAALIQATDGNFYGTTSSGGGSANGGTVFKVTPDGTTSILHSFPVVVYPLTPTEGYNPTASLIQATDGSLYGTTVFGGTYSSGTVFRVTTAGGYSVVHSFGGMDAMNVREGQQPNAALVQASDGNFYGTTTIYGGPTQTGQGTLFRMTPGGVTTTLHVFLPGDGTSSQGALVQGLDGKLYGTTRNGGAGSGIVFRIDLAGTGYTILHSFGNANVAPYPGASPRAGLIQASDGTFYGTTSTGGLYGSGTIFKMTAAGVLTDVHVFSYYDGSSPQAALLQAVDGSFYGTTSAGGAFFNNGLVFEFGTVPNLKISDVTFSPDTSTAGGSLTVGDITTNTGPGPAGRSSNSYFVSTSPALTPTGSILGNRDVPVLVANDTDNQNRNFILPSPLVAGNYFVRVCADRSAAVEETDETDNCRNAATTLTLTTNLTVTAVTVTPQTPVPGGTLFVAEIVRNTTTNMYAPASSTRFYLDLTPAITGSSILLTGSRSVFQLPPNQSSTGGMSVTIPIATQRGKYYVIACADDLQVVPESDESDNCLPTADATLIEAPAAFDPVNPTSRTYVVSNGFINRNSLDRAVAFDRLEQRRGAVTDGSTLLLLRAPSTVPVKFSIPPSGDDGVLLELVSPINGSNPTGIVDASPTNQFAWALYRAPGQFKAPGFKQREITVTVTPQGGEDYQLKLTLERTPVVLVHGAWDNPTAWTQPPAFDFSLQLKGFETYLADYEEFNARAWDPALIENGAVRALQATIKDALRQTRTRSIAATQVDIVGHSTGGLIARALIKQPPCGPFGPTVPGGDFQCNLDPINLNKGWIRHLITVGTPHNGAPVAKFLFEHENSTVYLAPPNVGVPLKTVMLSVGKPIDRGIVEDYIPGSPAFDHLGSTCDTLPIRGNDKTVPVRGYGIVGDHEPVHSPSWLTIYDILSLYTIHQTLDGYIGEANDVMSGLNSQWGRGGGNVNIPRFDSTVHSPSYTVFGLATSVVPELASIPIQTKVADLLELDAADPVFECFQTAPPPPASSTQRVRPPLPSYPIRSAEAPAIHFTSPAPGAVLPQSSATTLTLTVESINGASPRNLIFMIGNSISVAGPSNAPFSATIDFPADLPPGPVNILALAIDAVTGDLLADMVTVTVAAPGSPAALTVSPSSLVFLSTRQPPAHLRVLATFDRSGGSTAQYDVSAGALGAVYSTSAGTSVVNVDPDGHVTPVAAGTDTMRIDFGGMTAFVPVIVQGPAPFTDSVLTAGTTTVRAVHIEELRIRIDALRISVGLSPFGWTNPSLTAGATIIRAQHIIDLRNALAPVYVAVGLAPPGYTDPALASGMSIKAVHLSELRAAVAALE